MALLKFLDFFQILAQPIQFLRRVLRLLLVFFTLFILRSLLALLGLALSLHLFLIHLLKERVELNELTERLFRGIERVIKQIVSGKDFRLLNMISRLVKQFPQIYAINHRKFPLVLIIHLGHLMLEPEGIRTNRKSELFLLQLILEQGIVSHADNFLGLVDEIADGYLLLLLLPFPFPFLVG